MAMSISLPTASRIAAICDDARSMKAGVSTMRTAFQKKPVLRAVKP